MKLKELINKMKNILTLLNKKKLFEYRNISI